MQKFNRASLAVLLIAIGLWSLAGAFLGLRLVAPSDGARLQPGEPAWKPEGVVVTPLEERPGGLKRGDVVVAVDGQSLEAWAQALLNFNALRPRWQVDQTIVYTVQRDGHNLQLPIALQSYPLTAILESEWGALLFALFNQLVAAFVFFKRPDEQAARALFLGAASMVSASTWSFGLTVGDLVGGVGFWLFKATTFGAYMLVWIAALHMALVFPAPRPFVVRRWWIIPALYILPYVIHVVYALVTRSAAASTLDWLGHADGDVGVIQLLYLCLTMVAAIAGYRAARDPVSRRQVRWVLFAFFVVFAFAIVFAMLPQVILGQPLVSWNAVGLSGLLVPVAITIAILRYRLFDIDVVINRTLVYGTLTTFIIGMYVLAVGGLGELLQTSNTFAPILLTTVAIIALFRPLRARLQGGVDRLTASRGTAEKQTRLKQDAAREHDTDAPRDDKPVASIRLSPLDYLFRALAIGGVLEIVVFVATLIAHPNTSGLIGQGLFLRIWFGLIIAPAILLVGGLIVWRVSGNVVGRFLILIALGAIGAQFNFDLGAPIPSALAAESVILFIAGLAGPSLGYLMLTFPTGRVYPPHWTRVVILAAIVKFIGAILEILASPGKIRIFAPIINPLFLPALAPYQLLIVVTIGITGLLLPLIVLAGMISLVLRYHASPAPEQQKIKWVMWGFGLFVPTGMTAFGLIFRYGVASLPVQIAFVFAASGQILFLASIAIAILRYHLFDIDVLINRTLVYGSLTLVVVGMYVLAVGYLSELFHASGSFILSLLATGLIAVLFQPLRDRLQRAINRLMYGERDDPYAVLSRLGQRLEATLAPEAVLPTLAETIAQTLKLPYVAIALQHASGNEPEIAAAYGLPTRSAVRLPLTYQSERIGELLIAPRAPSETFTPAEQRLLADIAHQAGVAAHAVRLTADLQHSRERLVTAREEERRRLRRDLHDGLGPALAAHTLKVGSARALLARDPATAEKLLTELERDIEAAVSDIRRLVYDLRPPALDELGLVGAIRESGARYHRDSLRVSVEAQAMLPTLPAAVEVAAYRITQEALTNVVRHAQAHTCFIALTFNGELSLEIRDDGVGLAEDHHAGVGLTSMRERAAELGGTCVIEALPTGGTRILAQLPCRISEDL